ncbi:MAG: polysaccharide deacetylase [Gammaproteobacteria bacterium GWE2_37_16]|nr:MAG: polysaccharide deacetylase [Gammaproteobacteria bacterium GWE2_37_16]
MKTTKILSIKIDVDTERGTRVGVPQLVSLLKELEIPATFFFSLGPDHTGRALKRIFRKGFFAKVQRTSVVSVYGIRTLLNGVLLPGPHIGKCHADLMRKVQAEGFPVGIHCYDHIKWQDGVAKMPEVAIAEEFGKARVEFKRVFGVEAQAAAAPGWQANIKTLAVYDQADLLYGSDCRGVRPFYPRVGEKIFKTLQIPTTLPTLDELVGLSEFPLERLNDYYLSLLQGDYPNVMTIHAELEGMKYLSWFREFLLKLKQNQVEFCDLETIAHNYLKDQEQIPICEMVQGTVINRSGFLAVQDN